MPVVHAHGRVAVSVAAVLVSLALGGCLPERLGEPDTVTPELLPRPTSSEDPVFPDVGRLDLDVTHYDLDLTWDTETQMLTGVAVVEVSSRIDTPSLSLDFSDALRVTSTTLDGRKVSYVRDGDTLRLESSATLAGEPHTVVVEYRGMPEPAEFPGTRKDIPALGWTVEKDGQVWTMQEPYGAFTWYPVNDHPSDKATYDMTITVEAAGDFVAVAGGDPVQLPKAAGSSVVSKFRLDEPTASYLTTVAIGPYERFTGTAPTGPTPLSYWVTPGSRQESILRSLQTTPDLLAQLTEQLGPLPFNHLGAVVVPADSAMETQELVTMGAPLFEQPARMAIPVLAHEYAHQWYGNTVTPLTWDDLWLNEGFAMYLELEFRIGGDAGARDGVHTWLAERDQKMRDKFGPPGDYDEDQFASSNVYLSGALTLYELRERVGDEMFAELLREWPQEHHGMNATTEDYVAWVNARTGEDLTAFFDAWLTSPTTPEGAGPDA